MSRSLAARGSPIVDVAGWGKDVDVRPEDNHRRQRRLVGCKWREHGQPVSSREWGVMCCACHGSEIELLQPEPGCVRV
jgi:hypothetical protein